MKLINQLRRETTFKNGTAFIGIESPHLPYSIIAVGFNAGSRHDPPKKSGLAHLAEHVFAHRQERMPTPEQRLARLESLGIAFDAITDRETTLFYHSQLEQSLPQSLELLWNGITKTAATKAAVEQEKNIIADERHRDENDPQWLMRECALQTLWPNTGIAAPITGTLRTLKNITPADVRRWYRVSLHPGRATCFAIGSKKEVAAAEQFFAKKSTARTAPGAAHPKSGALLGSAAAELVSFCDATHHTKDYAPIGIFFKTTPLSNEKDRITLSFIKHYLAGSWLGLLIRELRIKRNLTYWVDADSEYFSDTGYLEFLFSAPESDIVDAVAVALRELRNIKQKPLTARGMAAHKTSLITAVAKTRQDPEQVLSWYSREPLLGERALGYQAFISGINALDGKAIQQAARAYLTPERAAIIIGAAGSASVKRKLNALAKKILT